MDDQENKRSLYLTPEKRKAAQAEMNRIMSQQLTALVGLPIHITDDMPTDEVRFVQGGKVVGKIINIGKDPA